MPCWLCDGTGVRPAGGPCQICKESPQAASVISGIGDEQSSNLLLAIARQSEREFRQTMRQFRICLRDLLDQELEDTLTALGTLEPMAAAQGFLPLVASFSDAVEAELEARVKETGWDKTKRLARRAATGTSKWLKTDEGKSVAGAAAVIAAALGFNFLG